MAKKKTKQNKSVRDLLEPGQALDGRDIKKLSNALTRIELRPSINAYKRQRQALRRDQSREVGALNRLSNRTAGQIGGTYGRVDDQLGVAQQAALQQGQALQTGIANTQMEGQQRQDQLQGSVLGGQINSLANQQIAPGQSASQNALAQSAAAQQTAQSGLDEQWKNLAGAQAAGMASTAGNLRSATAMQGAQTKATVRQALASRQAQTRADYGEARREVGGKLADTKALVGASRLKNLLDLRGGERTFINERSAIMADRANAEADDALGWARLTEDKRHNLKSERLDAKDGSGGSDLSSFSDFVAAARNASNGQLPDRVTSDLIKAIAAQEGVDLTPQLTRKYTKKLKRRIKRRG